MPRRWSLQGASRWRAGASLPFGRRASQTGLALAFAAGVGLSFSSGIQVVTAYGDTEAPSPPSELWLRETSERGVKIAWNRPIARTGIAYYRVHERVRLNHFRTRWLVRVPAVNVLEAELGGLMPGSTHEYAVSAIDHAGNESAKSSSVKVTTLRRPLAYRGVDQRRRYAVAGERFEEQIRALGVPPPSFSLVAAPDGMTIDPHSGMMDWTPPTGHEPAVTVVVMAANRVGRDRIGFRLDVRPMHVDREPPSPVLAQRVVRTSERGGALTWLPATDNVGVAGYRIFGQASGRGSSLFQVAEVPASVTKYELTTLEPGTRYRIWIVAIDGAGNTGTISGARPVLLRTLELE